MNALDELRLDHVGFYAQDAELYAEELARGMGFRSTGMRELTDSRTVTLSQGRTVLAVTEGLSDDHRASDYVFSHGYGVADIALGTVDARAAFEQAVANGARGVAEPAVDRGDPGRVTAVIEAFGSVTHTFVQRLGDPVRVEPGAQAPEKDGPGLDVLDHFAICLPTGDLDPTAEFYESVLGFSVVYTEDTVLGNQAMRSKVVRNSRGDVTLVLIEPDPHATQAGQIDDFLKEHGGAGVQHLALTSRDIVRSVSCLRRRDVEFLTAPGAYYDRLADRMTLNAHSVEALRSLDILVDEDHSGQLFQIFARSVHPRRTVFFEIIERLGATTFGSGNIKALYEAVEAERIRKVERT